MQRRVPTSFEWDADKAQANVKKHGVSFDEATDVFDDPFAATVDDGWHSMHEVRWALIGLSRLHRLLLVFHTDRGGTIRLISARLPTPNERRVYEEDQA